MGPCAICGVLPGAPIEVRTVSGPAQATLCTPCHEGVVLDARLRAGTCGGCRSVFNASNQATRPLGAQRTVVIPTFPRHRSGCQSLGNQLLETVPRPFAAWPQRRAWLVRAMKLKEFGLRTARLPTLLAAYRDAWLVGFVVVRSIGHGQPGLDGLAEAARLAASLGATKVRIVVDAFTRADFHGTLPDPSLSQDFGTRRVMMALDWDATDRTTAIEGYAYTVNDRGDVVFDGEPIRLSDETAAEGYFPELARTITDEPHPFAPVQFATWLRGEGHGIQIDPLPSGLARTVIRVVPAHRHRRLRILARRLGVDVHGQPEPHRMVVVVPFSTAGERYWDILGMHRSRDKILQLFRVHPAPPSQALLVDLDATRHHVQPITIDHDRVELGRPRSIADCTPDWLTATFGPSAPHARPSPFDSEPPDLPGPAL